MNVGYPLHQVPDGVDHGVGIDSLRSIFGGRLDDERELDVLEVLDASLVEDRGEGGMQSVEADDFFGDGFVHAEVGAGGAGPGVAFVHEVEEGGEMHLLGIVAAVGLGEVEMKIGFAARDFLERSELAVDGDDGRLVAEGAQGVSDGFPVGFGRLLLSFARGRGVDQIGARVFFTVLEGVVQDRNIHLIFRPGSDVAAVCHR